MNRCLRESVSRFFYLLDSDGAARVGKFLWISKQKGVIMKGGGFDWGNLVHWARLDLGLPLDEDYSISDEKAREMLSKIAETGNIDRPLMELVAAYGNEMRRIFASRIKDAGEMEESENEFWTPVVRSAGKYGGKSPVKHWLSVIAKRQAIAEYRPPTPDKVLEQKELAKAALRLARYLEQSEDIATRLIYRRYIEGASYKQMAREGHTTVSNMRTRVSRAIASSRQTLIDVYRGAE